jgi:nucleotide-binding universal stress UspA family protein
MLSRIVVPLDGSPTAEEILPHLRRILRQVDAEVVLVRSSNPVALGVPPAVLDAAVGEAWSYLGRIAAQLVEQGLRARSRVELGPAAAQIVRVADAERASMIALTTHGRSGTSRAVLGSVAEDILRRTPVPVLAVRAQNPPPPGPVSEIPDPIRKVLVPVDGSERALHAFVPAAELCRLFDGRLHFLRVLENDEAGERTRAKAQLEELEERSRAIGIDALSTITAGDPAERIVDLARVHKADAVAMATHGRRGLSRLLTGSVTEAVLRRSPVPLLVVRSTEVQEEEGRRRLAGHQA